MIKEMIYDRFDKIRLEKESRERTIDKVNFAPSYLSTCKRQLYYKKTNEPASNPIETHSYIKFEMGDAVHLSIQNILKEMDIYVEGEDFKEIEYAGLNWIYRIDGLLKVNDKKFIIEIKSVYAAGYNSIEKAAKPEHELQLLLYMLFEKIESGVLLYIGRDNGFIVEYNYQLESLFMKYKSFLDGKIEELKLLKDDIINKRLPGKDYNIYLKMSNGIIVDSFQKDNVKYKTDWRCSYCSWKNTCHKDVYDEIKNHAFYIDGKFID
jgi:CRISPR/Cas system-associated exonuclease Cas4 (RecB family)